MPNESNIALQQELEKIPFEEIASKNASPDSVITDLNLYDGRNTSFGYADINWQSSHPEIISPSGFVTRPETKTQKVTLTAEFTFQNHPDLNGTITFDITVPAGKNEISAASIDTNKIRLFIAGDSTACNYPHSGENNRYPQTGWGQVFGELFNDEILVVNCARSGRSSKSFLQEENYRFLCDNIQKGDYLFIQFAHNDSKIQDSNRYTSPDDGTYQDCIYQFINTARNVSAFPVLCTSITRNILEDTTLIPYADALKKIGQTENIPLLDLYTATHRLLEKEGGKKANEIYLRLQPRDPRFTNNPEFTRSQYYDCGEITDNTHLNINGAKIVAGLAAQELKRIKHPLSQYLK